MLTLGLTAAITRTTAITLTLAAALTRTAALTLTLTAAITRTAALTLILTAAITRTAALTLTLTAAITHTAALTLTLTAALTLTSAVSPHVAGSLQQLSPQRPARRYVYQQHGGGEGYSCRTAAAHLLHRVQLRYQGRVRELAQLAGCRACHCGSGSGGGVPTSNDGLYTCGLAYAADGR